MNRFTTAMRTAVLGVFLATPLACSKPAVQPPVEPLNASAEQLASIPNLNRGSYQVTKSPALEWQVAGRELRLRIVQPQPTSTNSGPFPLVVFSHGFASDIDKYDALFEHWASHGYIIIAPYHLDGGGSLRGIFNSVRYGTENLIAARVDDMRLILDHLDKLDELQTGLSQHIDREHIAAAGHSFGAFTAQQFGGAAGVNPDNGERLEGRDSRITAVLAISPPGEMFDLINDQSWLQMDTPMLATTGTWDVDGHFVTDWKQHTLSYHTAKPGQNWLLVVQGADHYLGNLICRPERDEAPQTNALKMVNAMAVTFLDAQLKAEKPEQLFLSGDSLAKLTNGFAALSQR